MPNYPSVSPARARNARLAVAATFFTNGALFANILPRYPEIKDIFDLSNAAYGILITLFPIGAIVAALAAATLIRRFGSAHVATVTMTITAVTFLLAGSAPNPVLFGVFLFIAGGTDAISDVGQNAHAMLVQKVYGRSIINSFHAIWSIGAVTGGLMSAGAIALDLSMTAHLGLVAAVFSIVLMIARANMLPHRDAETDEDNIADRAEMTDRMSKVPPRTLLMLGALVLLGIAGSVIEEVGNSWASLYLGDSLGAAPSFAAFGFIALVGGQFLGRILGDRQVDRCGNREVATLGGLIIAAGMGLALAFRSIPLTIVGFALAGYGSATLVPSAFDRADKLPGLRDGTGLTVISWLMRIGFLGTPPLIGVIADATSLRIGLIVLPVAGLIVMIMALALPTRKKAEADTASRH
ncbi:MFS transporter [Flaviflexus massiliensis]|uniref:MFS transporter n=1 Tax=Flaviflexus massiliensis TaxID=1522309 RepID=UPI0006D5ACC5|nr:MFS transporter [Flaviflexus massiliensis]